MVKDFPIAVRRVPFRGASREIYERADLWVFQIRGCALAWLLGLGVYIFLFQRCQEEAALIKHAKYDVGAYHARRHITGEKASGSLAA